MKIQNPAERLTKFWGKVDQKHINEIAKFVHGSTVLDMGAGYGTTSNYLVKMGFNVTAIDLDEESIRIAKGLNDKINYLNLNAEELPFKNSSFDTLILRDALHHFFGEADFTKIKNEINRIVKPNGRIIVLDPNINFMIKLMRKISGHKDEECPFEVGIRIIQESNFEIIHTSFNTIYSLPLSGGYVGYNFVPQLDLIQNIILKTESVLERMIQNSIGRHIAWRYLIVGKKYS